MGLYGQKITVTKRLLALALSVILCFSLTGCGKKDKSNEAESASSVGENISDIVEKYEGFSENTVTESDANTMLTVEEIPAKTDAEGSQDKIPVNSSGSSESTPDIITTKYIPKSGYIKWYLPKSFCSFEDDRIEKINQKLREDGYDFGLKIILYDDHSTKPEIIQAIREKMFTSGADIVYTDFNDFNFIGAENSLEKEILEGKYADLTEYIENGNYFKYLPQLLLDSMKYNGKIYLLSPSIVQDGRLAVFLLDKNGVTKDFDFEKKPLDIFKYISEDNKLYYGLDALEFVELFGYTYDVHYGAVVNEKGQLINPFEDSRCVEWMKTINKKRMENSVVIAGRYSAEKNEGLLLLERDKSEAEGCLDLVYLKKLGIGKRLTSATAILSTSTKKEEAFTFLELLRTNPDYGNLLTYGYTQDGEGEKPVDGFNIKCVLGIDDGLLYGETDMNHFMSLDERNSYYEDNVIASPALSIDFPPEAKELRRIIKKYFKFPDSVLFSSDFEERYAALKKEYTENFNKMKNKMKK